MEVQHCKKTQPKYNPGVPGMSVILPQPMVIVALLQYWQDQLPCCQVRVQPHRLTLLEIPYMALAFIATRMTESMLVPQLSRPTRRAGSWDKRMAM